MASKTAAPGEAPARRAGYARSAQTRAKIMAAALAEAAETGFHRTSVARIAARAGVAVGNLNYHFGSRGELLHELMAQLMDDLWARLRSAVPDPAADFYEVERAVMRVYIDYIRDNPAYARLVDEIKLHEPQLFARGMATWVEVLVTRLRNAVARGHLRPMSEEELTVQAYMMLGSRHFLGHMMEDAGGRPYPGDEAVIDAYLALVRRGLAAAAREPDTHDGDP